MKSLSILILATVFIGYASPVSSQTNTPPPLTGPNMTLSQGKPTPGVYTCYNANGTSITSPTPCTGAIAAPPACKPGTKGYVECEMNAMFAQLSRLKNIKI